MLPSCVVEVLPYLLLDAGAVLGQVFHLTKTAAGGLWVA